ncbi:MAG: DegT/DnrJ/EryC1/StrS family aminotransferase [Sphaerochaetaceae bacterium]|nr:DegT/DnrJ/EryC1/StrS family aminotransferase [Sphaerochaetaceae bacterium]
MMIQIEKPTLRRRDMSAVLQTMVDEHIGPGENSKVFLSSLCSYLNIDGYSVAFRSFIDTIYYAIKSLRLKENSCIGVSALSPRIYLHIIRNLGHRPMIFDIDMATCSFDTIQLEQHKDKLDALLVYEPYGMLSPEELFGITEVPIIVDITQSLGCADDEYYSGSRGDIIVMSFEQGDMISTGGGGAMLLRAGTPDQQVTEEISLLYPYIGLSDMNSALGSIQLANFEGDLERRRAIHTAYTLASRGNRHKPFGSKDLDYLTNGYSFLLTIESKVSEAIAFAKKYDVSCAMAFKDSVISDQLDSYSSYPGAIPMIQRTIRFPLYPFLMGKEISQVEKVISQIP